MGKTGCEQCSHREEAAPGVLAGFMILAAPPAPRGGDDVGEAGHAVTSTCSTSRANEPVPASSVAVPKFHTSKC